MIRNVVFANFSSVKDPTAHIKAFIDEHVPPPFRPRSSIIICFTFNLTIWFNEVSTAICLNKVFWERYNLEEYKYDMEIYDMDTINMIWNQVANDCIIYNILTFWLIQIKFKAFRT